MEFTHLAIFERSAHGLLTGLDVLELELALMLDPAAGQVIPGGRGLRKVRRPLAGRGKRGGARVIYYHLASNHTIYLVFAYAKNQQADLTKNQLQQLVKHISSALP